MKTIWKKLMSLTLVLTLVTGMLPTGRVFASDETPVRIVSIKEFTIDDNPGNLQNTIDKGIYALIGDDGSNAGYIELVLNVDDIQDTICLTVGTPPTNPSTDIRIFTGSDPANYTDLKNKKMVCEDRINTNSINHNLIITGNNAQTVKSSGGKLYILSSDTMGINLSIISATTTTENQVAPPVDKTALITAIAEAVNSTNDVKTDQDLLIDDKYAFTHDKQAIQTAITTANAVVNNPNATTQEVNDAVTAINTAKALFLTKVFIHTDKTAINAQLDVVDELLGTTKLVGNPTLAPGDKYTTQSQRDDLLAAQGLALMHRSSNKLTSAELDLATLALANAAQAFVAATKIVVNLTPLSEAIYDLEVEIVDVTDLPQNQITVHDYSVTTEQLNAAKSALAAGKSVRDDVNATQGAINTQYIAVVDAANTLRSQKTPVRCLTTINNRIVHAKTTLLGQYQVTNNAGAVLDTSQYIPTALNTALENAVANSEQVVADDTKLQTEIYASLTALEIAIANYTPQVGVLPTKTKQQLQDYLISVSSIKARADIADLSDIAQNTLVFGTNSVRLEFLNRYNTAKDCADDNNYSVLLGSTAYANLENYIDTTTLDAVQHVVDQTAARTTLDTNVGLADDVIVTTYNGWDVPTNKRYVATEQEKTDLQNLLVQARSSLDSNPKTLTKLASGLAKVSEFITAYENLPNGKFATISVDAFNTFKVEANAHANIQHCTNEDVKNLPKGTKYTSAPNEFADIRDALNSIGIYEPANYIQYEIYKTNLDKFMSTVPSLKTATIATAALQSEIDRVNILATAGDLNNATTDLDIPHMASWINQVQAANKLNTAIQERNNNNASQASIDAQTAILQAITLNVANVNTAGLTASINTAKAVKATAQASVDGTEIQQDAKWTIQGNINMFNESINSAEATVTSPSRTRNAVETTKTQLENTTRRFEGLLQNGTGVPRATLEQQCLQLFADFEDILFGGNVFASNNANTVLQGKKYIPDDLKLAYLPVLEELRTDVAGMQNKTYSALKSLKIILGNHVSSLNGELANKNGTMQPGNDAETPVFGTISVFKDTINHNERFNITATAGKSAIVSVSIYRDTATQPNSFDATFKGTGALEVKKFYVSPGQMVDWQTQLQSHTNNHKIYVATQDQYGNTSVTPYFEVKEGRQAPTTPTGGAITVENGTGTITGVDTTMEYKLSTANNWTPVAGTAITGLAAGTYEVRSKSTLAYSASTSKTVTITPYVVPQQTQQAPTIPAGGAITTANGTGTITGVDTTMEYKLSTANNWTSVTGTTVTGLTSGTYDVRYKETPTHFASNAKTVTITAYVAPPQPQPQPQPSRPDRDSGTASGSSGGSAGTTEPPKDTTPKSNKGPLNLVEKGKVVEIVAKEVIDSKVTPVAKMDTTDKKLEVSSNVIEKLTETKTDLVVAKDNITYTIPSSTIAAIPQGRTLLVEVAPAPEATKTLTDAGFTPVSTPVKFSMTTVDSDGSHQSFNRFDNYIERSIDLSVSPQGGASGTQPSGSTSTVLKNPVAITQNPDGSYRSLPTRVDGTVVRFRSLTNSIYTIVDNTVEVASVKGTWAETAVNNMASKMVLEDTANFVPNKPLTRGEFAEYIVKAMGLEPAAISTTLSDVTANTERNQYIATALKYNILSGYPDKTFKPTRQITRVGNGKDDCQC